jgi:hypothetical protein
MSNPLAGLANPINLLVIAPEQFLAAVQPLVHHKNSTGMTAAAVSVESCTGFFVGADYPERIKRAIQVAHEALGTRYVMLVGDAAHFPVRFWFDWNLTPPYYSGGITPKYKDGLTIPCDPMGTYIQSDLYYASLYHHTGIYPNMQSGAFDDWNKSGRGLYNQAWRDNTALITAGVLNTALNPDDVDGYPDIAVGRLPARSVADVTSYVNKVIAYETRPNSGVRRFTFVHDWQYSGISLTTNITSQSGLQERFVDLTYLLFENSDLPGNPPPTPSRAFAVPPPPPFVNATNSEIAAAARASTWVSYVGHGSPNALGLYGGFGWGDLAPAAQESQLPIVFAAGCQTSLFMLNLPWYTPDTFIDSTGKERGPFLINPLALPNEPGVVITDRATQQSWGSGAGNYTPLPVPTPKPNAINVANGCWADPWLFDTAPGGAIAYFGDHCVAPDDYPVEIETHFLKAYVNAAHPVLGSLYLTAQQQYWAGPHNADASTPGLGDYHGIPRLYLGWMVFFGDPSLRLPSLTERLAERVGDFDGDGIDEILVSSPWGIGILKKTGDTMTTLMLAPNGARLGGWLLDTANNQFGPIGDFDVDGRDEILVTSPWGLGVLRFEAGALTAVSMVSNGTVLGGAGSQLDTTRDKFGPVLRLDGGNIHIFYSNSSGVALLSLDKNTLGVASLFYSYGSAVGNWTLDATDNFGPVGDFDGDGHNDILVTSAWGIGVLKLGTEWTSLTTAANGTALSGGWKLDTNDKFSIAGNYRYNEPARDIILVTSPWGIGTLMLEPRDPSPTNALVAVWMAANGSDLGGWRLDTAVNEFGPAADYAGVPGPQAEYMSPEILVTSPWGIGVLAMRLSPNFLAMSAIATVGNGTRLNGWDLNTASSHLGAVGKFEGGVQGEILVTSQWGMAILKLSGDTMTVPMMQKNGTRMGQWVLDTTKDVL